MTILGLPPFTIILLFIVGSLLLVFLPYSVGRWILRHEDSTVTKELASSILFRIGALHALILALVFADGQAAFIKMKTIVTDEAASVTDVFYDLERYDEKATVFIRSSIVDYAAVVVQDEWDDLAEGRLNEQAWTYWRNVFDAVLNLEPENLRQETLRELMVAKLSGVAQLREKRWSGTKMGLPFTFWVIALAGFALVSLPYYVFAPRADHIVLLTTFALYNGLVLYLILDVSKPYQGLIRLSSAPFQFLLPESALQSIPG